LGARVWVRVRVVEVTSLLTAGMGGRSGRSGTDVSFGSLEFHLGAECVLIVS
jgi:hypothetical protein